MSADLNIPLLAVVADYERPVVEAAVVRLAAALSQATGQTWTCRCDFAADLSGLSETASASIVVTSLSVSLGRWETPWPEVEKDLRADYGSLCTSGAPVMICTILRHVEAEADFEKADRIRRRLRQLNLLATELSREYGAFVIDLDRVVADIGARRLNTDYRLGGSEAVDVAGNAMALSIATNAMDNFAPVDVQEAARSVLEKYRHAAGLAPEIEMTNIMAFGRGRRKQRVSTVTDTVQENHIVWLMRQVLARQIGIGEAIDKLRQAVRRRGARESAALVFSGIARLVKSARRDNND